MKISPNDYEEVSMITPTLSIGVVAIFAFVEGENGTLKAGITSLCNSTISRIIDVIRSIEGMSSM